MKCDKCKSNEADIFIGYLRKNREKNLALCESCSDLMGIASHLHNGYDESFIIDEDSHLSVNPEIQCPICHTDISHVLSTGQMGCPQCYLVFKKEVEGFFNLNNKIDDNRYSVPETLRDLSNEFIEN